MNRLGMLSIMMLAGVLIGCGGGGGGDDSDSLSYTGVSTAVAVTSENSEILAATSIEAATKVIEDEKFNDIPFAVDVTNTSDSDIKAKLKEIGLSIARNTQTNPLPTGAVQTITASELNSDMGEYLYCNGSITASDSGDENSGTVSITFNNLCVVGFDGTNNAYLNGTMKISWGSGYEQIIFSYLSVTINGEMVVNFNAEMSCTWNEADYSNYVCTSATYYTGTDGKVYKVADSYAYGDDFYGWNAEATVYHPDYGYVTIVASNLKFECSNGSPSAGNIVIRGSDSASTSIEIIGCNSYSVTHTSNEGSVLTWLVEG